MAAEQGGAKDGWGWTKVEKILFFSMFRREVETLKPLILQVFWD
jgi:hypothetical protein